MAELAPLTSAHAHIRKATALKTSNCAEAAEEHQQAATDFARAARGSSDSEALRILKLLEHQHQRLARIVNSPEVVQHEPQSGPAKNTGTGAPDDDMAKSAAPSAKKEVQSRRGTSSLAGSPVGKQGRDSSPSLARDIAARRGIPQSGKNPPSAAAQARARQLSPESRRRASVGTVSTATRASSDSRSALQQTKETKKAEDDDGFARFYSNLTSGAMSKLSTALAYAGLPLSPEQDQSDRTSKEKLEKRTVSASNDPDVKRIFSKAALDAIEDDHGRRGTRGHGFGPAESFYVVQKGGGTYSYADIAKAQQQQLENIGEDDEAEFVDAREAPAPSSLKTSRILNQRRSSFGNPKTQEELELENTIFKQTVEHLTTRLEAFEAHAQDASMAALTQSMASLRPAQDTTTTDAAMQDQIRQLQKELDQGNQDKQELQEVIIKNEKMLRKYHARYEQIKKSAVEKDRVKKEKVEKGSSAPGDNMPGGD